MPKLRKMLGRIDAPETVALMRLIETQSQATLARWAVCYARSCCLALYEAALPGDARPRAALDACAEYLDGGELAGAKRAIREAVQAAREAAEPVAQAAARAISTACATVTTPTNALGFLFYTAAAVAYSEAGTCRSAEEYDALATRELERALDSLRASAVADEPHPAHINWNC